MNNDYVTNKMLLLQLSTTNGSPQRQSQLASSKEYNLTGLGTPKDTLFTSSADSTFFLTQQENQRDKTTPKTADSSTTHYSGSLRPSTNRSSSAGMIVVVCVTCLVM